MGFRAEKNVDDGSENRASSALPVGSVSIEHLNHLKRANELFYDQVKAADQKAAYIFTFMLAFLMWLVEGQGIFTRSNYMTNGYAWISASAVLAVSIVFTIVCAILVILPRRIDSGTSLYWGAWSFQRDRFVNANETEDMTYMFTEYLENADAMSRLARDKYRMVGFAFRGLLLTVFVYVLVLLLRN
jgi:hypothetical protein